MGRILERIRSERMQKTGLLPLCVKCDVLLERRRRLAAIGVATPHTIFGADASGVVAELGIELRQFIRRVFLILKREIFAIPAHFAAAHLERFRIAHITWMQDI